MAHGVKEARQAAARGAYDEALVFMWNALEPARLSGDRGALRRLGALAQGIARSGDDGQRREAERLLAELQENMEHGVTPATATLDAQVEGGGGYDAGETVTGMGGSEPAPGEFDLDPEEEEEQGRAGRIGNLLWLAFVVFIILVNVIGQVRE